MAKKQIQIGLVYSVKVAGTFLPVRIDKSLGHGRYEGVAMSDGKTVKTCTDAVKGDGETAEQWEARQAPKDQPAPAPKATGKPTSKADAVNAAMTAVAEDKKKRSSGLDAAATVLAEAGEPLNTAEMVKRMLEQGLWSTGGKTPAATIYAAIIREISVKGEQSRFRKTDRGHFELTAAGKGAK